MDRTVHYRYRERRSVVYETRELVHFRDSFIMCGWKNHRGRRGRLVQLLDSFVQNMLSQTCTEAVAVVQEQKKKIP